MLHARSAREGSCLVDQGEAPAVNLARLSAPATNELHSLGAGATGRKRQRGRNKVFRSVHSVPWRHNACSFPIAFNSSFQDTITFPVSVCEASTTLFPSSPSPISLCLFPSSFALQPHPQDPKLEVWLVLPVDLLIAGHAAGAWVRGMSALKERRGGSARIVPSRSADGLHFMWQTGERDQESTKFTAQIIKVASGLFPRCWRYILDVNDAS